MSAEVESVTVGVPVPSMLHGDVLRSNFAETPTLIPALGPVESGSSAVLPFLLRSTVIDFEPGNGEAGPDVARVAADRRAVGWS